MVLVDEGVEAALVAAEAGLAVLRGTDFASLGNADRLDVLERLERVGRSIPGIGHELVAELESQGAVAEFPYGGMSPLLAGTLRVRFSTARRMIAQSKLLADRAGISGAMVAPVYPLVGPAQRGGLINADHVGVILEFFAKLPSAVSAEDRESAEAQLVDLAKSLRPDQLAVAAARLMAHLNPDGSLEDERDRRKELGFWMGPQDADGLTRGTFCFDARLRAMVEAFFAKFARPGMCNPEDEEPVIIPEPEPEPECGPEAEPGIEFGPGSDLGPELVPPPTPPPPPVPPSRGPVARRRRSCPACGGEVDAEGKAAAAPGGEGTSADQSGRGGGGPGVATGVGHGRGHCSGHGPGDGGGRREDVPEAAPDSPAPDSPAPDSGGRDVPAPPSEPEATAESELEPALEPDPERDLGLPPALALPPAPGSGSGASAGGDGFDAEALAAAAAVDLRPFWLRNVDALAYGFGAFLGDPALGQHRGLPVTAVVTMTVKDLEAATGKALSGGGAIIPIRDAVRMAAHAYPYLLVFDDDGRPLYLGRGKRLASADQRFGVVRGGPGVHVSGLSAAGSSVPDPSPGRVGGGRQERYRSLDVRLRAAPSADRAGPGSVGDVDGAAGRAVRVADAVAPAGVHGSVAVGDG